MKILVTGGAGFIGTNICLKALEKGHKVIAFDSLIRKGVEDNILDDKNYTLIRGDVRSKEDLKRIGKIDGVFHLAANPGIPWSINNPMYDFEVNAGGTLNLLELARERKVPLIYASTNKVYSDKVNTIPLVEGKTRYSYKDTKGIKETFPLDAQGRFSHSPYGCSKLAGDIYCQEYFHTFGVQTVVNRMSCIYGQHQMGVSDQGWVAWFMIAKLLNLPLTIYGDGKQVRDCLYGEDVAELYLMELENIKTHAGQVYNIGGGPENTISVNELISWIDEYGGKMKKTYTKWRPADHKVYISDITKISKYWKPKTSLELGLTETFDWVEANIDSIERTL